MSSLPDLPRHRDADDDYCDFDDDEEDDEDFFDDDFTRFCRYRGQEVEHPEEPPNRRGRYVCLHYFSNTVGLTFGETNVEVYRMEQIKEWSSIDPNWLDNLRDTLDQVAGKKLALKLF